MKFPLVTRIFDRDSYYETTSRTIRWICLGLVVITYPPAQLVTPLALVMIAAAAAFNLLHYSPSMRRRPFFQSRFNLLVVDYLFVFILVLMSGGLSSPYYPFFYLLLVVVIASYGIAGFAMALAGQVIITLVLLESRFTRRVENERQRLLALINSLSSAVLAIDESGKVYLYNAAALELLNTNRDISGGRLTELLPLKQASDHAEAVDIFELARHQDKVITRQDLVLVARDDSAMVLDLTISPVHGLDFGASQTGGYMVVFHDITKQKSLEEERDEFISVTSHELRTPLAIAEANLSTALLPGFAKIDPKAVTLLNQTHDNIVFLSQLIEDLASLARAERDSIKLDRNIVNLKTLVDELVRDYRPSAQAKGLELDLEADPKVKTVYTSEHELREMLQNFITNAIKYTDKGRVTLSLTGHTDTAVVSVSDTGIGISASDKTKIFGKFYRSEDYRTRKTGGTGLGLYITKKLAERLGMKINFTSRLNHGSTFSVTIPYRDVLVTAKLA
jgi:signal transduction histidine kinase